MSELLRPDDTRDALRKIGALLFGIGVLMLLLRKATIADDYARGVVLIILLVPAALFYGGGVLTERATGGLRAWQTVYGVFGYVFVTLALIQLVDTIDEGASGNSLNVAWIFAVVAATGFYSG
ncbi:MAG TPA: hypothetical protein VEL05_12945, partial [Candidatus Acidoferrum sp.]|nr:hypothetical protein [Candidatus Acidoferrum sp.]